MSEGLNLNSTWKKPIIPRGKYHNKTETKTTVSLYLSKNLVERAKNHKLNLSKITEQALSSILDYMEAQNIETTQNQSSNFLHESSFPKEVSVPRAGFEPATTIMVNDDLEDFKLFAKAKLNLSNDTVRHYVSRVRAFLKDRNVISDRDIQLYIAEKKQTCKPDYVSNIISSFKAYFRDFKGLSFMNGYRHPSGPLKLKEEIEPSKVKRFIEAIDDLTVKCIAVLLAISGLRKSEVWNLGKTDIDRELRAIIPNCHSGETKHSGISFYTLEAEKVLEEYLRTEKASQNNNERLFVIGHERFLRAWRKARQKSGVYLKPKDLRDFFSQELGKALIPDRFIDIFQGRAPKNVLAKHYTPQGIRMLREIYDKANLKVLA